MFNFSQLLMKSKQLAFLVVLSSAQRNEASHDRGSITEGPFTLSAVLCRVGRSWAHCKVELCDDGKGPTQVLRAVSPSTQ